MIRPVFANTAIVPTRERLILKGGTKWSIALRVRVGLIMHPIHGPVLIDAGYGPQVTSDAGRSFALRQYANILRPQLISDQSPITLLKRHGCGPSDVRYIIVTHFHADHTSYLRCFDNARFLIDGAAWESLARHSAFGNLRHGIFRELLPNDFADRMIDVRENETAPCPHELGQGYRLLDDNDLHAIPLPGHAPGHIGVLFGTNLLYATDTQWMMKALIENRAPGLPASATAVDGRAAKDSADRVRRFHAAGGEVVLCHDPIPTAYDI